MHVLDVPYTMHPIAAVLVCLACAGNGRRIQPSWQGPSKVLAQLFHATRSPEAGWHRTAPGGNFDRMCGGSGLTKRAKCASNAQRRLDTRHQPARANVVAKDERPESSLEWLDQLQPKSVADAKTAEEKVDKLMTKSMVDTSQTLTTTTSDKEPVLRLMTAYTGVGYATAAAWAACACAIVLNYPDPLIKSLCNPYHKLLMIAQTVAFPLPMAWAMLTSLRSAAKAGWGRLQSATYRRLNLGLAASSLWMACAVYGLPLFTVGYDISQPILKMLIAAVHCTTTVLCVGTWFRSVEPTSIGHYVSRLVRGFVSSAMSLGPKDASDNPDSSAGRDGRAEYALCTALFAGLSILPLVSSLPLATGQAVLALDRPTSAWTWVAATVCYVLKDAAERGRLPASTFVRLRHGLAIGSAAHLFVIALKLSGIGSGLVLPGKGPWQFYPNVLSMPFTTGVSLATYALALFVSCTPPPPEGK